MNFISWLKPKTTAMIFFATIYSTQGKILVKSIIPQEYTVLREETTITLFYCVRSNHLLLCGYREKKRHKHLNLGYGNCFVIGLTLQMLLFSTKSSQRHFFEENSLAYNICACLATLFLGWHFLTLTIFHLPLSRLFIWSIKLLCNRYAWYLDLIENIWRNMFTTLNVIISYYVLSVNTFFLHFSSRRHCSAL